MRRSEHQHARLSVFGRPGRAIQRGLARADNHDALSLHCPRVGKPARMEHGPLKKLLTDHAWNLRRRENPVADDEIVEKKRFRGFAAFGPAYDLERSRLPGPIRDADNREDLGGKTNKRPQAEMFRVRLQIRTDLFR